VLEPYQHIVNMNNSKPFEFKVLKEPIYFAPDGQGSLNRITKDEANSRCDSYYIPSGMNMPMYKLTLAGRKTAQEWIEELNTVINTEDANVYAALRSFVASVQIDAYKFTMQKAHSIACENIGVENGASVIAEKLYNEIH